MKSLINKLKVTFPCLIHWHLEISRKNPSSQKKKKESHNAVVHTLLIYGNSPLPPLIMCMTVYSLHYHSLINCVLHHQCFLDEKTISQLFLGSYCVILRVFMCKSCLLHTTICHTICIRICFPEPYTDLLSLFALQSPLVWQSYLRFSSRARDAVCGLTS